MHLPIIGQPIIGAKQSADYRPIPISAFSKFFKWIFFLLTRNKYISIGILLIYLNLDVYKSNHHFIIKYCWKGKYMHNIRITVMSKHSYMQINFQHHRIKTKTKLFSFLMSLFVSVWCMSVYEKTDVFFKGKKIKNKINCYFYLFLLLFLKVI